MIRNILARVALVAMTSSALAHSKSEKTIPANAATVTEVEVIEMRFDKPMRVTAVVLNGPQGEVRLDRATGLDPVTEFRAFPPEGMPAGAYTLEWRGLSEDGHPMQGNFGFTVAD